MLLHSNQLTNISTKLGKLKKLEVISISDNKITELPSNLCNLPVIRYFDLIDKNLNDKKTKRKLHFFLIYFFITP